ncbi:hypothetical protein [Tsukamurella spumae]|uniref:Uncharacterized protein n=1 Tax=Tsukamurella spumae TaxID=44753 RepID=A0A846X2W9_9ACTN|nr:hypothetical protein [Tsukamurella spumae]NKY19503.1 hypothetical protein [Tsukamurella spumae]
MMVIAAALWIAAALRLNRWLQNPRVTPAVGAVIVLAALAALTTSNTRLFGGIGLDIKAVSAVQQLLLLAACVGAEVVLAGIAEPARLARRFPRLIWRASFVGAAVVVLFVVGPAVPVGMSIYDFAAQYAGNQYIGTAFLLVQIYSGVACARVAYFALKLINDERLRIPMVLLAAGAAVFTLYAIARSAILVASLAFDFEPHLRIVFTAMSSVAAVGAGLLIAAFCWVPVARTLRDGQRLSRQAPIYCQVTKFDPSLRADWRIGGFSLSRRADAHATVILDFLTLLLPQSVPDSPWESDSSAIASWLALPSDAATRPEVHLGMLAVPDGRRPAEWLDEVLRRLPGRRSPLLDDLL